MFLYLLMPINKYTIEEKKREFIGNYYLSIYLHSASEAVAAVWDRHFDRSKKKGSIPSPKHSLGKLAQKKWNFNTTEAFFNECPNFKSTTDFFEFLTQNIISPKKHTRIRTDTDALAMAQYFEECLSWSRDCIIEKTWELISEYYKRFYPFRVSTFHPGLAKEYVEKPKKLSTDGTMQRGATEGD